MWTRKPSMFTLGKVYYYFSNMHISMWLVDSTAVFWLKYHAKSWLLYSLTNLLNKHLTNWELFGYSLDLSSYQVSETFSIPKTLVCNDLKLPKKSRWRAYVHVEVSVQTKRVVDARERIKSIPCKSKTTTSSNVDSMLLYSKIIHLTLRNKLFAVSIGALL